MVNKQKYHCPGRLKPHMNAVYLNKDVDDTMIFKMIDHSYDRVVKKLTRREKAELYILGQVMKSFYNNVAEYEIRYKAT